MVVLLVFFSELIDKGIMEFFSGSFDLIGEEEIGTEDNKELKIWLGIVENNEE